MIYTIGHKANYLKAIADSEDGIIQKTGRTDDLNGKPYPGGYALQTIEDAIRLINEFGYQDSWDVFGIKANWETDTYPSETGWWHNLLCDADIVVLHDRNRQ